RLNTSYVKEIHLQKPQILTPEEFNNNKDTFIAGLVLTKGQEVITFDDRGGEYIDKVAVIKGVAENKEEKNIDVNDIFYVRVERVNTAGTILANLGVIALAAGVLLLIALATKESCPFIYSYDGEKYVFDAEPLGGATTRGLQREEFSKLDYLKESDGKYKLLVRNEVEETQYLDELSLYVIDHNPEIEVVVDNEGNLHSIANPVPVIKMIDENHNDLIKFITEEDNIFWQSPLPNDESVSKLPERHKLTLSFNKPADVKSAKLIVNAGTSLWGSNMIREMLSLYGDKVDEWYDKIDNGGIELNQLMYFMEREELYLLKIYVKEKAGWSEQGLIKGGGPFISEKRVYNLDLSNVEGDSLLIQLNPPFGFWTIDYMALEFNDYIPSGYEEIKVASATDHLGENIDELISFRDGNYYIMPEVGNYFYLNFDAPSYNSLLKRTIFLKSYGYYKIHLSKDQPIQTKLLFDIATFPGKIVNYSLEKFMEWRNEITLSKGGDLNE
ncbi:hypothetical protein ACFLS9_09545, partial [Bacteroidota bacterium]